MKDVIIAIGSNTNQEQNMEKAQEILSQLLYKVRFTASVWTKSEGGTAPTACRYLNALAYGSTSLPLPHLQTKLKQIEESLGDPSGNHRHGIVNIDLDLLCYDSQRLREEDWKREYIKKLLLS